MKNYYWREVGGYNQIFFCSHENFPFSSIRCLEVPQKDKNHRLLGNWVSQQRWDKKKNKLPQDKITLLESNGFIWEPDTHRWNETYEILLQYVREYGHSRVPQKQKFAGIRLGAWIERQRSQKKKEKLLKKYQDKLEALPGWVWNPSLK